MMYYVSEQTQNSGVRSHRVMCVRARSVKRRLEFGMDDAQENSAARSAATRCELNDWIDVKLSIIVSSQF